MAGTYAEMVQLASDNAFLGLCKVAVVKQAKAKTDEAVEKTIEQRTLYYNLLTSPESYSGKVAFLIATCHPTISAAAPAVPTDAATQTAVNAALNYLMRQ